jgi:beta-glucosidase
VVWQPYGGEEAGSGLSDIIWGHTNPSARLPLTVYKQAWSDEMNCKNFTEAAGAARHYVGDCATSILRLDLEAGVGRTHRYLNDTAVASFVKHHMGYGLSYTTFVYSSLKVAFASSNLSVSVTVKNTGDADGSEVVQVYAAPSKGASEKMPIVAPLQNLVGFVTVLIPKGSSKVRINPLIAHAEFDDGLTRGTQSTKCLTLLSNSLAADRWSRYRSIQRSSPPRWTTAAASLCLEATRSQSAATSLVM